MPLKYYTLFIVILILNSCNPSDCCQPADLNNIVGQYRVYEYGYSPGDQYIVEEVAEDPPQLLTFNIFGQFSSNYQDLADYSFYRVYDHPTEGRILALFKESPPTGQVDLAKLEHSYIMQIEKGNIKLRYRYCIEGCHIGVRKLQ